MRTNFRILFLLSWVLSACYQVQEAPLPIIGERKVIAGDTLYHKISDFQFVNQDSQAVNNKTFAGQIYVADFFFTSCPTICPRVKKQMLRLYEKYEKDDRILLLSHSIDVKRDTVGRLKQYAHNLGVQTGKWHFVTGQHEAIYDMADDYFSTAKIDTEAPGGFDHSGLLILVDANRHVRSYCDGTDAASVDQLMQDIDRLLRQEYSEL